MWLPEEAVLDIFVDNIRVHRAAVAELTVGLGLLPVGPHTIEIELLNASVGGGQGTAVDAEPEVLAVAEVSFECI